MSEAYARAARCSASSKISKSPDGSVIVPGLRAELHVKILRAVPGQPYEQRNRGSKFRGGVYSKHSATDIFRRRRKDQSVAGATSVAERDALSGSLSLCPPRGARRP